MCLPQVMKGYFDNKIATEGMFDSEGFLRTGDIGYFDTDVKQEFRRALFLPRYSVALHCNAKLRCR